MFRVVELSEGYEGRIATTESYFYALDTLPLFIAVVVYTPFWPGRFISNTNSPLTPKDEVPAGWELAQKSDESKLRK